jgi:hypothetical protein
MLTNDTEAREAKPDLTSAADRRRYIAELARPHIAGAIATLERLAANAKSPGIRRAAQRDLKRYRARVAKAGDKP